MLRGNCCNNMTYCSVLRPQLALQAVHQFTGGETEALARFKYYLWDTDLIATYFLIGGDSAMLHQQDAEMVHCRLCTGSQEGKQRLWQGSSITCGTQT